ncbi:MAG: sugar phosphate isomerase/epimerase [Oscillospiraceae bacterium]|nr:sugar phosphate isomerase/epimerase [Oscillospiraceae bacterium]
MPLIHDFSIQLYSVRHEIEAAGFPAALEKLSEIGYTGVEFAGYGGLSAAEMTALLQRTGLKPVSAHIGLDRLEAAAGEEIAYHKALGTAYIVVPSAPFASPEEVEATAARLNALAPRVREAGFGFGYHNHDFEFRTDGGRYRLERLLELAPDVDLQLDVFWASRAGCDCAAFMTKYASRITMLHIKQMDASGECADLGDGVLDFAALIGLGLQNGVREYIHEQETFSGDAFAGLARGYRHILSLQQGSLTPDP